jgi:hypothetical protein
MLMLTSQVAFELCEAQQESPSLLDPNSKMILNVESKRQTAVSLSTPEAEIAVADYALRQKGMPTLALLSTIVGREVTLSMMDDNEAMIEMCYSGKNPTMRYLNRTREVGISWLMDVFKIPDVKLYIIDAKMQVADVGIQRITCVETWPSNCVLINLANKDTNATQLRSSLITLRLDASDKFAARKARRKIKEVGKLAAPFAEVPTIPHGGVFSSDFDSYTKT